MAARLLIGLVLLFLMVQRATQVKTLLSYMHMEAWLLCPTLSMFLKVLASKKLQVVSLLKELF